MAAIAAMAQSADDPVIFTGMDAAISKHSAASSGYNRDPFIPFFVDVRRRQLRRAPLINRGYFARTQAVDQLVINFLKSVVKAPANKATAAMTMSVILGDSGSKCPNSNGRSGGITMKQFANANRQDQASMYDADVSPSSPDHFTSGEGSRLASGTQAQIVTLGAGNDTLFFRLRTDYPDLSNNLTIFETDFPSVIARKQQLVASHPCMKSLAVTDIGAADGNISPDAKTQRYHSFGSDLRDIDAVAAGLASCGFNPDLPTLFLSECVLIYLDTEYSNALIRWAANTVNQGVFITYEQILPFDAFGAMMVRNIAARGCPLRSITNYPTLASLKARYEALGWTETCVRDMNDVYYNFLHKDEVKRIEKLEIFDELEEWHLIQGHYCITVAIKVGSAVSMENMGYSNIV